MFLLFWRGGCCWNDYLFTGGDLWDFSLLTMDYHNKRFRIVQKRLALFVVRTLKKKHFSLLYSGQKEDERASAIYFFPISVSPHRWAVKAVC